MDLPEAHVYIASRRMDSRYSDACSDILAASETLDGAHKAVAHDAEDYDWLEEGFDEVFDEFDTLDRSDEECSMRALMKSTNISASRELYWEFEDESADCNEAVYTIKSVKLVK